MYWIVELDDQLKVLINSGFKESFVEVIPQYYGEHPRNNPVSLVYFKPLLASKGYMLCVSHSETFSLDKTLIDTLLKSQNKIYVRDKKEFLHYFPLPNLHSCNVPPTNYDLPTTITHTIFYEKTNLNYIVPLVKHYELCEQIYEDLKDNIGLESDYSKFFNNKVSLVFNYLERNGIEVDKEKFEKNFHPIDQNRVYTQYNLHTLTTRPSNSFKGVNYAALNKTNKSREAFIPINDKFIDIDITAYHPSIVAMLIGYKFSNPNIHQSFADLYGVSYKEAKILTFKQLNGGVFPKYKDLEFFQKMEEKTNEIWVAYNKEGYYICPISSYKFEKDKLSNMNPQKLLNYILQAIETAQHTSIVYEVINLLKCKKTKIVLYVYDSILIDFKEGEEDVLDEIIKVYSRYGLNIKLKMGVNYHDLE